VVVVELVDILLGQQMQLEVVRLLLVPVEQLLHLIEEIAEIILPFWVQLLLAAGVAVVVLAQTELPQD
jgi:hypothetical protein